MVLQQSISGIQTYYLDVSKETNWYSASVFPASEESDGSGICGDDQDRAGYVHADSTAD